MLNFMFSFFCLHICMKNNFCFIILPFFNIMSKISLKIKNWTADLISIIYLLIYYRVKKKLIKFTKDDTQECSDNHVLSINLLSFSTTILMIYDNDNSDDLCQRSIFSSTRIYKTKLEYILILTYKYLGLIIICIPIIYSYMMSLSYISEFKNKIYLQLF